MRVAFDFNFNLIGILRFELYLLVVVVAVADAVFVIIWENSCFPLAVAAKQRNVL